MRIGFHTSATHCFGCMTCPAPIHIFFALMSHLSASVCMSLSLFSYLITHRFCHTAFNRLQRARALWHRSHGRRRRVCRTGRNGCDTDRSVADRVAAVCRARLNSCAFLFHSFFCGAIGFCRDLIFSVTAFLALLSKISVSLYVSFLFCRLFTIPNIFSCSISTYLSHSRCPICSHFFVFPPVWSLCGRACLMSPSLWRHLFLRIRHHGRIARIPRRLVAAAFVRSRYIYYISA
jgi:hypothetical protein